MAKRKVKKFEALSFHDACDRLCGNILQDTMKGDLRGGVVTACLNMAYWEQYQSAKKTGEDWDLTEKDKKEWFDVPHDDLITLISNHVISKFVNGSLKDGVYEGMTWAVDWYRANNNG